MQEKPALTQGEQLKRLIAVALATLLTLVITVAGVFGSATATAAEEPCVPAEAYTETTDWVLESPGEGWYLIDERKVIDKEATEDEVVFDYWQRYSLTGGSWPEGPVPAFPDPGEPFSWQPNVKGDPHNVGVEGAYFRSNGASGNTDWFYLEAVTKVIPGQEEESHQEYRFAFDHPEVECPVTNDPPIEPNYSATLRCPPAGLVVKVEGVRVGLGAGSTEDYDYVVTQSTSRTIKFVFTAHKGSVFENGTDTLTASVFLPILRCVAPPPQEPPVGQPPVDKPPVDEPKTPGVPTTVDAGLASVTPAGNGTPYGPVAILIGALVALAGLARIRA